MSTASPSLELLVASLLASRLSQEGLAGSLLRIPETSSSLAPPDTTKATNPSKGTNAAPAAIPTLPQAHDEPTCASTWDPIYSGSDIHSPAHCPPPHPVAPTPPTSPRDSTMELRDVVDAFLQKKRTAWQELHDENAALRQRVAFLDRALAAASAQPGSETGAVLAALERERARGIAAEESRAATGRFLAEQIEAVSKQKISLEAALTLARDGQGRDVWRDRAIAALQHCEELEAENLHVKRELAAYTRKQPGIVDRQIGDILREVAEERERLRQLEETEPLLKYSRVILDMPKDITLSEVTLPVELHRIFTNTCHRTSPCRRHRRNS